MHGVEEGKRWRNISRPYLFLYIRSLEKDNFCKSITLYEANENNGLANSVIHGVSEVIQKHNKVIVLEDDLIISKDFIEYMNECLDYFENKKDIWSISGFSFLHNIVDWYKHDIYLSYRGASWGWATWKDRWDSVDWQVCDYVKFKRNLLKRSRFNRGGRDMSKMLDRQMAGQINSWAIRWCYQQSKKNMYTIYPTKSKVKNIGLDGTGTHCGASNKYDMEKVYEGKIRLEEIKKNRRILKLFKNNFGENIFKRAWNKIKNKF